MRDLVHRASRLEKEDRDSANKLKNYHAPLIFGLLDDRILFNFGLYPLDPADSAP